MDNIKKYLNQITHLPTPVFEVFFSDFNKKLYKKGDYFAEEGRYESQYGILTEGVMRAFYRNTEGVEYNKTFFVPTSFVGALSSLVSGEKNLIYIQCLTDCTIWVAPYARLVDLYKTHPETETLSRKLSERYFMKKEKKRN